MLRLQFSQGLNALDSNVIIHQSRNIVNGTQQENNAEQLSFFENSTLEDTEVEIPFAVGDEIDYGERHYTISKINKEKIQLRSLTIIQVGILFLMMRTCQWSLPSLKR